MSKRKRDFFQEVNLQGLQNGIVVNYLGSKYVISGEFWHRVFDEILAGIARQKMKEDLRLLKESQILSGYEKQLSE